MTRDNIQTALETYLAADAGLTAWASDNFNKIFTEIKSNRPVEQINDSEIPARIYEIGDTVTPIEVSNHSQACQEKMPMVVVWNEKDNDAAYTQAAQLSELMIKVLMLNPTLTGACNNIYVSSFAPDRNANYPMHFMDFELTLIYRVINP